MQLPNRRGRAVDSVPFLVVSLTGAMACFAGGVPYFLAAGLAFGPAAVATSVAALFVTWGSYYEFVWTATGPRDVGRPAGQRLQRVGYAVAAGVAVGAGLLLPVL